LDSISISDFLNDPDVQEFIETRGVTVVLHPDHSTNLTMIRAGNNRIFNVPSGHYYIVEEWDKEEDAPFIESNREDYWFVLGNGGKGSEPEDSNVEIGILTGSSITGLTNENIYRVTQSKPYIPTAELDFYDLYSPPFVTPAGEESVLNGVINLDGPFRTYLYLDLEDTFTQIIQVPITPAGSPSEITPVSSSIIQTLGANTTTDYILYNDLDDFFVLRVIVGPRPPLPTLAITLVPVSITDNLSAVNTSINLFGIQNASTNTGYTLTITASSPLGSASMTSYTWKYGTHVFSSTTNSLTIDFHEIYNNASSNFSGLLSPGTRRITLEAVNADGNWSAIINLAVSHTP
jgi:hypothetical protein